MKQDILFLVSRIYMQVLKEQNIAVMFACLEIAIESGIVVFGKINRQLHLDLWEAFGEQASDRIPLSLGCGKLSAFVLMLERMTEYLTIATRSYNERTLFLLGCFIDLIESARVWLQCGRHLDSRYKKISG